MWANSIFARASNKKDKRVCEPLKIALFPRDANPLNCYKLSVTLQNKQISKYPFQVTTAEAMVLS